jgi:hypothetical protein
MEIIPAPMKGLFQHARTVTKNNGTAMAGLECGNMFTDVAGIGLFGSCTGAKKKNTAPAQGGVTGMRIDHIAALGMGRRQMTCSLLSLVYLTGPGHTQRKCEIVNWIPEEEGNPDIAKRRPLVCCEVLRKMCMGVKKRQIVGVWVMGQARAHRQRQLRIHAGFRHIRPVDD